MLISFTTCQRMKVSVKTDTTVELISTYIKKADILEGSKTLFLLSFLLFLFLVNKGVIQICFENNFEKKGVRVDKVIHRDQVQTCISYFVSRE